MYRIQIVGAGYVGGPTMAVIAQKCPEYKIIVSDINPERIAQWQSPKLPIYEPGLRQVVNEVINRNLFFTTDISSSIKEAAIIFVSVNTPTKTFGAGAGKAADLQYWEQTARDILAASESDKIIVEKSTLPVRTAEAMARILNNSPKGIHFEVLSNPEFLAEGTAIKDLQEPSRVLIGGMETEQGKLAIDEQEAALKKILPELELKRRLAKEEQEAAVYKGKKGIKSVAEDVLKTRQGFLVFGAEGKFKALFGPYFKHFHEKRAKNKIKMKIIFNESLRTQKREKELKHSQIRYIKRDYENPATTWIYGDKIAIILWSAEPMAFLMRSQQVASSYREFFTILWEAAKS